MQTRVDKTDYPRVFRLALPRLKSGGLFIADNVLWSGRVTKPNPDATTKAILEAHSNGTDDALVLVARYRGTSA